MTSRTRQPGCRRMGAAGRPPERVRGRPGARNINVAGRRQTSPIQGFGRMWQKTYRVAPGRHRPARRSEVIETWKEHFPEFWPKGNRFFAPLAGIAPGEVAALDLSMPGGLKLSTGVLVLYADDESFTLMTPQGHMFAGWITFSAFVEDGVDLRPGAGADAGQRPDVRAGDDARRPRQGGRALDAHAAGARGSPRRRGRGRPCRASASTAAGSGRRRRTSGTTPGYAPAST